MQTDPSVQFKPKNHFSNNYFEKLNNFSIMEKMYTEKDFSSQSNFQ